MSDVTRKGKIASLPAAVREEVNRRLFDGERGPSLLKSLNENADVLRVLGEIWRNEPITPQNLSEWRNGGFQDWLQRREREDSIKVLADYSLKLAQASGGSITEGAAAIAGGRILELLEKTATTDGADNTGDPKLKKTELGGLIQALVSLRHTEIAQTKVRQKEVELGQRDRGLLLEEKKFQRQTADFFLKFYKDQRARDIAEGKGSKEVKMDELVKVMFGERPATSSVPSLK
jgi:hypothetical protein